MSFGNSNKPTLSISRIKIDSGGVRNFVTRVRGIKSQQTGVASVTTRRIICRSRAIALIEEVKERGVSSNTQRIQSRRLGQRQEADAFSNSGVLVFTPHLPSATLAASDIVKAILFRKLRLIFSKASPFFETVPDSAFSFKLINELIDRVEDVYDSSVQNLDAFALDLAQNLGDHPITRTVQTTIDEFRVHYVLNLFNGVDDSFNTAVKPFLDNLTSNVSARCGVTNLGWITRSDVIHQANCNRIPALLVPQREPKKKPAELDIRAMVGLEPPRPSRRADEQTTRRGALDDSKTRRLDDPLSRQLDTLKSMFEQRKDDDFNANFEYVTQRTMFTMKNRRPSELGDVRVYTPAEMLTSLFAKSNVPTTIDWSELE